MDLRWKYQADHSPNSEKKKKVKIEGKELGSIPLEVFSLDKLQVLEMSPERESCLYFQMKWLPREIGHLQNLSALYMDTNFLKEVPPEIGTLKNLKRLSLSNNFLTFLPQEFAGLQSLQSLHMANNSFDAIPSQVCEMKDLTFLDASDNKIRIIPSSIQQLKRLETLSLVFNRLETLPEDLCRLRNLRCLWLGYNNLSTLPHNFGDLGKLDWGHNLCSFNFEGNPLVCPPPEVCSRGPEEISRYFVAWRKGAQA
ncbi:leucine-rich repeat protein lrrA-like [Rhinatrema bivittatum]|uniref:leucine-rich repeat protein lrrA-like n=1 Tax=Rhinatrema bivittatum TaxID=194408 RepID=UPI00112E485D|nr:leucine-rich repeat protein lrrA-like [Rhinatrema bivittatum]